MMEVTMRAFPDSVIKETVASSYSPVLDLLLREASSHVINIVQQPHGGFCVDRSLGLLPSWK